MTDTPTVDELRDAVRLSFAYRLSELNRKTSPMTRQQIIEREARKYAEQDAAIDALIAAARAEGEAAGRIGGLRSVPCESEWREEEIDCLEAQRRYQRDPDASFPMCPRCRLLAERPSAPQ